MKKLLNTNHKIEIQFGLLLSFVMMIIAIYFFKSEYLIKFLLLILSQFLLYLTVFIPSIHTRPAKLWISLGVLIGYVVNPIIMFLLYLFIVIPSGIYARLFKKITFETKFNFRVNTYWLERKHPVNSFKRQF